MPSFANFKLGRSSSEKDPRNLQLSKYFPKGLREAPPIRRWDEETDLSNMLGNDVYGNCTYVTAAHAMQLMHSVVLDITTLFDEQDFIELCRERKALRGYSILQRNKDWRKLGILDNKIEAFASFDSTNANLTRQVVNEFSFADIGLLLPRAWQESTLWDIGTGKDFTPNSWGSHSVPIVGYNETSFFVSTWGRIIEMTSEALTAYSDEGFAIVDKLWISDQNISPSGILFEDLMYDVETVSNL
jgi:hypothetical protein